MSKGVAIRTILLLLIGVIAVGIIAYLVYSTTRSPVLSCTDCRAKFISYCTQCALTNSGKSKWDKPGWPMGSELINCIDPCDLHHKSEDSTDAESTGNCDDAVDAGRKSATDPCITCIATNLQGHCRQIGVG